MKNKYVNTPDKCKHYPMLGLDADVRHGGCWKIIHCDFSYITRKCIKCGLEETSRVASYNSEMFMSDRRRYDLAKDRDENAVNMIQPIDQKTGKFNEEFGRHYGYNPLKTPAPQLQNRQNDVVDDIMSGQVEEKLKLEKLPKR